MMVLLCGLGNCAAPGRSGPPVGVPDAEAPDYAFDVAAEAGVPRRCIAHVMAMPLLTRNGDPAVEVTVDGVRGAAFLSPSQSVLGVYETRRLRLPVRYTVPVENISGPGEAHVVEAGRLEIAQGVAKHVEGFDLGPPLELRVAGRPPVAVIGFDVLGNYDLLLDMPRQRAMLFRPSRAPNCPPLSRWIAGAHAALLEVNANGERSMVRVRLDGRPVAMTPEPAAEASVIGRNDAAAVVRAGGGGDDRVRTQATDVMVGVRHRFQTVAIGDWQGRDFVADVEPARWAVLGLPFFRHREVLLAFADGAVFFDDAHPDLLPPDGERAEPGPMATRVAHTAVIEVKHDVAGTR